MKNGWNSLRKKSRKNWKVLFWKVHRLLKYRLQPGRGLMNWRIRFSNWCRMRWLQRIHRLFQDFRLTGHLPCQALGQLSQGHLYPVRSPGKTFWKCIRSEKSARFVIFRYMGRIRTNAMPDREWRSICQMWRKRKFAEGVCLRRRTVWKIQIFWMWSWKFWKTPCVSLQIMRDCIYTRVRVRSSAVLFCWIRSRSDREKRDWYSSDWKKRLRSNEATVL